MTMYTGNPVVMSNIFMVCFFCSPSSAGSSGDDGDDNDGGDDGEDVIIEDKVGDTNINPEYGAIAPVMVPDVFPRVPLLCVHRNPVFPRFVKMLEV